VKLDALESRVDATGQRLDRQSLGQPRYAFEQYMSIGQQPHQQAIHQVSLPDNHACDFILSGLIHVLESFTSWVSSRALDMRGGYDVQTAVSFKLG
jgi:hypothetical protein